MCVIKIFLSINANVIINAISFYISHIALDRPQEVRVEPACKRLDTLYEIRRSNLTRLQSQLRLRLVCF